MTTTALTELMEKADALTPEERWQLVNHLVTQGSRQMPGAKPRRKWEDLIGLLPYPALGEDAQTYISRTRREGDERREQLLRGAA
jgi:hypothetical protein